MRYTVNFEDNGDYPLIDQGMYNAICTGCDVKESERGNKYFQFDFEVTGGQFAGLRLPPMRNMIDMKDKNYYLQQTLFALEYIVDGLTEIDTEEIVGRRCRIQIIHSKYEGKTRAEIAGIFPLDESGDVVDSIPEVDDVPF